jgi:hypothetical protein
MSSWKLVFQTDEHAANKDQGVLIIPLQPITTIPNNQKNQYFNMLILYFNLKIFFQ